MQKGCNILAAFLFLTLTSAAQAQWLPSQASLRYSAQISNGPAGDCGCFTLQGAAGDLFWNLGPAEPRLGVGIAFDAGVEHTGDVNGADYPINRRLSLRFILVDYLRTALPNNSTNW
jgi:hypothetical protein